ncbi:hypothetical protein RHSIM_Rhsim07G0223400 [Rhododendron simsii]|uniref:Uncharacterized protein n=1 Tax=Rhododendron simsii TaxID=118357 RepID=A0A834LK51_RHOSS|nr:hypothetical protein RHSIM_Rhsim07G0223400 [Rhododendron simsii]
MALRKKSSSISPMKSLCFVFVVLLLMMGTQFRAVHCRALRELRSATTAEQVEADELMAVAKFDNSSRNSRSGSSSSVRGFSFKSVSGPSTKGVRLWLDRVCTMPQKGLALLGIARPVASVRSMSSSPTHFHSKDIQRDRGTQSERFVYDAVKVLFQRKLSSAVMYGALGQAGVVEKRKVPRKETGPKSLPLLERGWVG